MVTSGWEQLAMAILERIDSFSHEEEEEEVRLYMWLG